MRRFIFLAAILSLTVSCSNPSTPAGYVGYVTKQPIFLGKDAFYDTQSGPTSTGLGWRLYVTNVSVTPYTYYEAFTKDSAVLSRDNMKIEFAVQIIWKVKRDDVRAFVERYSTISHGEKDKPDDIVLVAYNNFLKEPLRSFARDEIQRLDGLTIKDRIGPIGQAISQRVRALVDGTPFDVTNIVVGNIQYPPAVADAVAQKMATTQLLEQKATEIKIEEAEKSKRIIQAEGVARAMDIIQIKLTPLYIQHEAIEAQKAMVGSPNHTTIYIPVGPMGVPIVQTLPGK